MPAALGRSATEAGPLLARPEQRSQLGVVPVEDVAEGPGVGAGARSQARPSRCSSGVRPGEDDELATVQRWGRGCAV
jgi:hypothetical protein